MPNPFIVVEYKFYLSPGEIFLQDVTCYKYFCRIFLAINISAGYDLLEYEAMGPNEVIILFKKNMHFYLSQTELIFR